MTFDKRWFRASGVALLAAAALAQQEPILNDAPNRLRAPRSVAERRAKEDEPERAPAFDGTPSTMSHYGSAKQGSTWLSGPQSDEPRIQIVDFERDSGERIGTSPWHVVTRRGSSDAVVLWGASLTDAYRVIVDGDRFELLDSFVINHLPVSVPWNLTAVDNGRVIVPDPDGRRVGLLPRGRTDDPSFLVLREGRPSRRAPDGAIELEFLVEMTAEELGALCGESPADLLKGRSGTFLIPTFTGEMATTVTFERNGTRSAYFVVLDANLRPLAAARIGPSSPSNDTPAEALGDGRTAFYVPTDEAIVKMVYDSAERTVTRAWTRDVPVRSRLGTTPTLMDTSDGEKLVLVVDAKAAVATGLNGLIVYSDDERPSALVAVRRDDELDGRAPTFRVELPDWLNTVENSPAVRGDFVVIANYTGYLPNGLEVRPGGAAPPVDAAAWGASPDAESVFSKGILALRYVPALGTFRTTWSDPDTQISGVPAISASSNRVYGSGAEQESGDLYLYGYRLRSSAEGPAGERTQRVRLGKAPFRMARRDRQGNFGFTLADYRLRPGELFDAGNSTLVLEDGSLILSLGRALLRVRDR